MKHAGTVDPVHHLCVVTTRTARSTNSMRVKYAASGQKGGNIPRNGVAGERMTAALALMVCCPLTDELKQVSENCTKCPHYAGQMYEGTGIMETTIMLNCAVIEDAVMKVEFEEYPCQQ